MFIRVSEPEAEFFTAPVGSYADVSDYQHSEISYLRIKAKWLGIEIVKRQNKVYKVSEGNRPIKTYGIPSSENVYLYLDRKANEKAKRTKKRN